MTQYPSHRPILWKSAFALAASLCISLPARSETLLYDFSPEAGSPNGPLTLLSPGHFCGVTFLGGTANSGTVYCLTRQANGSFSETAVVNLGVNAREGRYPDGKLALAGRTNLYGVGAGGGKHRKGTVFQVTIAGIPGASPHMKTIYTFGDAAQDGGPAGGVVIGADGSLYGASGGGADSMGAVFRLTPPAAGSSDWTETIIHSFSGPDGYGPRGGLAIGSAGILYGATSQGGSHNAGVVYALTPPQGSGSTWGLSILHQFGTTYEDGVEPNGDLLIGSGGVIYGTTYTGGVGSHYYAGVAYALTPPAAGQSAWQFAALHEFGFEPSDGTRPNGGLIQDSAGNLYGTTYFGSNSLYSSAVAYKLTPQTGQAGWTETILQRFKQTRKRGAAPGELVFDANGRSLLGVTNGGGIYGAGTVFRIPR